MWRIGVSENHVNIWIWLQREAGRLPPRAVNRNGEFSQMNPNAKKPRAVFVTPTHDGRLIRVEKHYNGLIPETVLKHLADVIIYDNARGRFKSPTLEAMDAYQEIFLRLHTKASKGANESDLVGTIFRTLLELRRTDREFHERDMEYVLKTLFEAQTNANTALKEKSNFLIEMVLKPALKPQDLHLLRMWARLHNKCEVARILGLSKSTCRRRLAHAITRARIALDAFTKRT